MWVFTHSGSGWTQQGAKLTGGEEIGEAHFGYSLALSANGNTALIGGPHDDGDRGAEWVFTREGAGWTQEGVKLTAGVAGGESEFGYAGALSAAYFSAFRAESVPAVADLEVVWRSPDYYHCNFTALASLDEDLATRWQEALLAMSYDDPSMRQAMTLEGVKRWLPGDRSGYAALAEAMAGTSPGA